MILGESIRLRSAGSPCSDSRLTESFLQFACEGVYFKPIVRSQVPSRVYQDDAAECMAAMRPVAKLFPVFRRLVMAREGAELW